MRISSPQSIDYLYRFDYNRTLAYAAAHAPKTIDQIDLWCARVNRAAAAAATTTSRHTHNAPILGIYYK